MHFSTGLLKNNLCSYDLFILSCSTYICSILNIITHKFFQATSIIPAVSDNYLIMFLFLTFDNLLQPVLNQGGKRRLSQKFVPYASTTLNNIAFIINLQQHPLWYSGEVPYLPVDDDSDCYPWITVWEDSLIIRLLY